MNAFISGSHTYGSPDGHSDIDLVIRIDQAAAYLLLEKGDPDDIVQFSPYGAFTARHGDLNVIACWTDEAYNTWKQVTRSLFYQKPVTRNEAIECMNNVMGRPDLNANIEWCEEDLPF